MGLERETAFPCIFNYLFKLKDDVCSGDSKKVESQLIEAGKSGVIRIGIQVRNTEADDAPEHFFWCVIQKLYAACCTLEDNSQLQVKVDFYG